MGGVKSLRDYSRRDAVGRSSARSVLLTALGEFALRHPEPVWTTTFVHVLGLAGIDEPAARQALARTAAAGWLEPQRAGRRTRWALTDAGRRLLTEGARRIYTFGRTPDRWDGRWTVVLVSVSESRRALRHRLRTRLSWAGFGSPAPGVWISPDPGREAEAGTVLADLGLAAGALSFTGPFTGAVSGIGEERAMVEAAWDLDEIGARYRAFAEEFAALRPESGEQVLLAQTRLVHAWRRFPFDDPQLPARLLPPDWPGTKAAAIFHGQRLAWHDPAQARWRALANAAG